MSEDLTFTGLLGGLVALIAAGAVLAAIVRRPQNGVLLVAALTPFNGLLIIFKELGIPPYWKEALLFFTGLCALMAVITKRSRPTPLNIPWWPAVAILMVYGAISAYQVLGTGGWMTFKISFFYVGIVIILCLVPFTFADRDRLVTIMMAVAVVNAVVGLGQQLVGVDFLVSLGYRYGEDIRHAGPMLRSIGTFNQPFPYGLFLMMVILVGLPVALGDPARLRNKLFFLSIPLLVAGMAVSMVRASYLGLIIGLVCIGIIKYRKVLVGMAAIGALGTPLLFLIVPPANLSAVFSSESLTARTSGWNVSGDKMLSAPFGQGLGAVGSAAEKVSPALEYVTTSLRTHLDVAQEQALGIPYQPDNYYIKLMIELGPIGLWLFVLFIGAAFLSCLHVARHATDHVDSSLAVGVCAFVLVVAADSVVATYLEIFPIDVYTWLLLGTVGCIPLRQSATTAQRRQLAEVAT